MSELAKTSSLIFNEYCIRLGRPSLTHCQGCCKDARFLPRLVKNFGSLGREVSDILASETMKGGAALGGT